MQPITELNPYSGVSIELNTCPLSSSKKFLEDKVQLPNHFSYKSASGCLYRYLENKKLKNGAIASYPRISGLRDVDNPHHWRWGYSWEDKVDGQWRNHSIYVPKKLVCIVRAMIDSNTPSMTIRNFVQGQKSHKNS